MLVTVLVTKKAPAVVTVAAPPLSFSFGPQVQPTVTPTPASKPTSTPVPVPFPDHTGLEKVPTSQVDTWITTSFVTGDISVPTSPPVDLPSVGKPESGDSSVEPTARLAGIASAVTEVTRAVVFAASLVPGLLNPVTDLSSAVPAPSEMAATVAPSKVVVDGHTFVAGASHTTLTINGQAITVEPSQIIAPGTTIAFPVPLTPSGSPISSPTLSATTVGSITFSLDLLAATIGSSTYSFSPGAPPLTTIVDGQAIRIGANGIGFASTTVPIPIGQTSPTLLPVVANGLDIDVGSNKAIINGVTYAIGSGATPQTVVIGTNTVTFGPGGVSLPTTTIPPYYPPTVPSPVVVDGLTFSIDATQAVISGKTYAIGPGAAPKTVVFGTETISLGPDGVGLPATTIPPYYPPTVPSPVVVDGLTFSIDATQAVISGKTYAIGPGAAPKTVVFGTETISLGPGGVGLPATTIPPYYPPTVPSPVVVDGLTFLIDATQAVISGKTYAIGPGAAPKTVVFGTETISLGPDGVGLPATTIPPYYPPTVPSPVVVDGLTFSIDATQAIISGTTYAIGPGAASKTVVFGTETISLGPGGVGLPMTTLVPPALPSVAPTPITADGLTFSIEPSDVVIGGSTYAIGRGAPTETLVVSGETVVIGPGGVALPTTTIPPPGASSPGLVPFTGAASTFGPVRSLIGGCLVCLSLGVVIL
ncbi:MAG: hypothetical protein LQ347_001134 [Umbilicaria vellea]|nr:MAG: hypothetical protein LQ347_001134 [Umbilicaria vellea]